MKTTYTIAKGTRYNSAFIHNHGDIIYYMTETKNGQTMKTPYCTDGFVAVFNPKTPRKIEARALRAGDCPPENRPPIEKIMPQYNDQDWSRLEDGETWTALLHGSEKTCIIASKDLKALQLAGVLGEVTDIYRHNSEYKPCIACDKSGAMVALIMPFVLS